MTGASAGKGSCAVYRLSFEDFAFGSCCSHAVGVRASDDGVLSKDQERTHVHGVRPASCCCVVRRVDRGERTIRCAMRGS